MIVPWRVNKSVVEGTAEEVELGGEEFGADQHRHQAADEEEEKGGEEVLDADFFVVGGEGEVSVPAEGMGWG